MKLAVENSSKRWNYVEAVLRDWVDKGYQTLDDVHAARLAFKYQTNHQSRKKPIRQEYIPDWLQNRDESKAPVLHPSLEEKKRLLGAQKKKYSEPETSRSHDPAQYTSFQEKKRLFEERLQKT